MVQTVLALMQKEFKQIIRDRNMLRLIFLAPMIQLLVLGYAINTDVKNIYTAVYDFDRSQLSRDYIQSLSAGDYFVIKPAEFSLLHSDRGFTENRVNVNLIIPPEFSQRLEAGRPVTTGFMVDGTNANSAAIAMGYAGLITNQFNRNRSEFSLPVSMRQRIMYNPEQASVNYMVPGIVAVLLLMITSMLTSMAIVREREVGTLEQLMVTPIPTPALIMGKTIPFAILGFIEMSAALAFGIIWFGIPFVGSWPLLYSLSFVFLFTTLGVGMFISTMTQTQQQAMFFSWFFMIFAILTSGFFTPISNMPESVQYLTYLNPLRYFIVIIRGIMMKGAGVGVLYPQILALMAFGLVIFSFSVMRFSKRVK
jgi:ABC-2 type transport system permease protein